MRKPTRNIEWMSFDKFINEADSGEESFVKQSLDKGMVTDEFEDEFTDGGKSMGFDEFMDKGERSESIEDESDSPEEDSDDDQSLYDMNF